MKRGRLTQQIDSLRKEMNNSMTAQFIEMLDVDKSKYIGKYIEGKRYISNEKQGYVLIKNVKSKQENILFHTTLDDEYARFKERELTGSNADLFQKLEREPAKFQVLAEKNASRKRLKSDSSDDGIGIKISKSGAIEGAIPKDEVEFMSSSSSSEESENESSIHISNKQKNVTETKQTVVNSQTDSIELSTDSASERFTIHLAEKKATDDDDNQHVTVSKQNSPSQTEKILVKDSAKIKECDVMKEICSTKETKKELEIEPIKKKESAIVILETNQQSNINDSNDVSPTTHLSNLSTHLGNTNPDVSPKNTSTINIVDKDNFINTSSSPPCTPSDILSPVESVEMSTEAFSHSEPVDDDQQPGPSSAIPVEVTFFLCLIEN